jgi:hypothetical protein
VTVAVKVTHGSTAQSLSGSVSFFDGGALLATVGLTSSGVATLTVSLAPGAHSITASFPATDPFLGSTSAAVGIAVTAPKLHISASLITKKAGKKTARFIHLTFSDGRAAEDVRSPFQPPAFRGITLTVEDTNGDGSDDSILVTAGKGKRTRTETLAV